MLTVERGLDRYFLQKEREKQIKCFRKFVPTEFTEILSRESLADIELGECVKRNMSVLFIDIRGFDNLLQHMSPEESFCIGSEGYGTFWLLETLSTLLHVWREQQKSLVQQP